MGTQVTHRATIVSTAIDERNESAPQKRRPPDSNQQYGHSFAALLELIQNLDVEQDVFAVSQLGTLNLMGHLGITKLALWLLPDSERLDLVLLRVQGLSDSTTRDLQNICSNKLLAHLQTDQGELDTETLRRRIDAADMECVESSGVAIIAPLVSRGTVIGIMALGAPAEGLLAAEIRHDLLRASLFILAMAMDNARLRSRMHDTNRQLLLGTERLQQLDQSRSSFINTLDHELRTPITVMEGYLEILTRTGQWDGGQSELLHLLKDQTEQLSKLVGALLEWKSLSDDKTEINQAPQDPAALLTDYFHQRKPGVTSSLRNFSLEVAETVPAVTVDPDCLVRILDALVDKALQYTPQGSRITLSLRGERENDLDWVRIDVDYVGTALSPDHVEDIVESMSRVTGAKHAAASKGFSLANAHATGRTSRGVSLTAALGLTQKMGGRLDVECDEDQGARFILRFIPTTS